VLGYAEQRALEIAMTTAAAAPPLLLDEPTARMNNGEIEQAGERD
jgi:ABC-type branched-subunit amino acid transport system ATPase component